jgi:acetylornithine deacetylase/succinyl-diaminopimelate desuccinylase-like protein
LRTSTGVPDAVATVGQLAPSPGATNVIAGRAVFSLDVRSPRDADRTAVAAAILAECRAIAARRRVTIDIVQTHELASCGCAGWLQAQLSAAIAANLSAHRFSEYLTDPDRVVLVATDGGRIVGSGPLDEAELGVVGPVAHELRVDRHRARRGDFGAKRRESSRLGDQRHCFCYTACPAPSRPSTPRP